MAPSYTCTYRTVYRGMRSWDSVTVQRVFGSISHHQENRYSGSVMLFHGRVEGAPKLIDQELEKQPKMETVSSEKGIKGTQNSLVHITGREQTKIQEESKIDTQINGEYERYHEKFTEDELRGWTEAFAYYDTDKNGEICLDEFETAFQKLGVFYGSDKDILRKMIEENDRDGSGTINFLEFLAMMSKNKDEELRELKMLFDAIDKNGDGFITADELKSSDLIKDKRAYAVIAVLDTNGDGKIDFTEFQNLISWIDYYSWFADRKK